MRVYEAIVADFNSIRVSHATGIRPFQSQEGIDLACDLAIHQSAATAFIARALPGLSLQWARARENAGPAMAWKLDELMDVFCDSALRPYDIDSSEPLASCHPDFLAEIQSTLLTKHREHPDIYGEPLAMAERAILLSNPYNRQVPATRKGAQRI
jgi:hypothetical protein